jgi:hypothetical protein
MLRLFKARVLGGNIDFAGLMRSKYEYLWAMDINAINYMKSIVPNKNDVELLTIACNAFYQFSIILSCIALAFIWKRRENSVVLLFPLYMVGLSLAHMLTEVAGRYHYSGILVFTILSAYILTLPAIKSR